MDYLDFSNFLNERMRERGLTLKKISEISGVPLKHLENLAHGHTESLPPSPYIRGYILKLGKILDFDSQTWWENLQKEKTLKSYGEEDRPPENRFARVPFKRYVVFLLIILAVLIYLGYNFYRISGKPEITVLAPSANPAVISQNYLILSGKIVNGDKLTINGEEVALDKNGYFEKTLYLQPGVNTIGIAASKFLGGENKIIRQIIYEPASATSSAPTTNSSTTSL